jgi:hypothetical protein
MHGDFTATHGRHLCSDQPRNQMRLVHSPGAPRLLCSDVTTLLYKNERIANFTDTDSSTRNIVVMLPYYCTEEIRESAMMMQGYERRDWAAHTKEMLEAFGYIGSRPDSFAYTCQCIDNLCVKFWVRDETESLNSYLRIYDHIGGVVTECG